MMQIKEVRGMKNREIVQSCAICQDCAMWNLKNVCDACKNTNDIMSNYLNGNIEENRTNEMDIENS